MSKPDVRVNPLRSCVFYIYCCLIVLLPVHLNAQTSFNVSISDPIYRVLDLLVAHRLIDPIIVGQRPYTRLEIARLLKQARQQLALTKAELSRDKTFHALETLKYVEQRLNRWSRIYAEDTDRSWPKVSLKPFQGARYSAYITSARTRRIPEANGVGVIEGFVSSFDAYDHGRTYRQGLSTFLDTQHTLRLSPFFVFMIEPQIELDILNDQPDAYRVTVLQSHARFGLGNIDFQIGRGHLIWGQGEFGGLLISTHARPLDMLKIDNPYPWHLPWLFRYLGPSKFTFFVANLGPERILPYAFLYGAKISFRPIKPLEIGFSQTVTIGGNGAPSVSFFEPVTELFPIHKFGRNIQFRDIANHVFGLFDMRLTLPGLRGSAIYWESSFDDSPARALEFSDNLINQMSMQTGFYIPRLTATGTMALRLEYQHTAPWAYRHSTWLSGYTLNQRSIGSPLGPAADGLYLTWSWWPVMDKTGTIRLAYEVFRRDFYTAKPGDTERIIKSVDLIDERRLRLYIKTTLREASQWSLVIQTGVEYINHFNFNLNDNRYNGLLGLQAVFHLDHISRDL